MAEPADCPGDPARDFVFAVSYPHETTAQRAFLVAATVGRRGPECIPLLPTCHALWEDSHLIRATGHASRLLRSSCRSRGLSVARARALVSSGADLGESDLALTPPLILACVVRNDPVACELVGFSAPAVRDAAAVIAAEGGSLLTIAAVAAAGVDVNTAADTIDESSTRYLTHFLRPLHAAVVGAQPAAVRLLLDLGACPDCMVAPGHFCNSPGPDWLDFLRGGAALNRGTPLSIACAPTKPISVAAPRSWRPEPGVPIPRLEAFVDAVVLLAGVIAAGSSEGGAKDVLSALFWIVRYVEDPAALLSLLARVPPFSIPQLWAAAMHAASPAVLAILLRQCRTAAAGALCSFDINARSEPSPESCVPACTGWITLTPTHGTLLDRALCRGPSVPGVVCSLLEAGAIPTRSTIERAAAFGDIRLFPALIERLYDRTTDGLSERLLCASTSFSLLERVCCARSVGCGPLPAGDTLLRTPWERALVFRHRSPDEDAYPEVFSGKDERTPSVVHVSDAALALLQRGALPSALALRGACSSGVPDAVIVALMAGFSSPAYLMNALLERQQRPDVSAIDIAFINDVTPVLDLVEKTPLSSDIVFNAARDAPLHVVNRLLSRDPPIESGGELSTALLEGLCVRLSLMTPSAKDIAVCNMLCKTLASGTSPTSCSLGFLCRLPVGRSTSASATVETWPSEARLAVVEALLARGATAFVNDRCSMLRASPICNWHGDRPTTPLESACCSDSPSLASILLRAGALPSTRTLHCAASVFMDSNDALHRWLGPIRMMLAVRDTAGNSVIDLNEHFNAWGETLLRVSLRKMANAIVTGGANRGVELVAALLESGVRVSLPELMCAAFFPWCSISMRLLERFMLYEEVHSLDEVFDHLTHGVTLLHLAARFGNEGMCRALLDAGATVDARLPDGRTPLHDASDDRNASVVRLLLERGADPAAVDNSGAVPDLTWMD